MSFGQGGPYGPGGGAPQPPTPDWNALADDTAARGRRRTWLLAGGGLLATGAVAAIVAIAVTSGDNKGSGSNASASRLPTPQDLPSGSSTPEPTFSNVAPPAPPKPLDIISSAKRDKAPLSAGTLFPEKKAVTQGRGYTKAATSTASNCASVAQGGLAPALSGNGCRKLFRATYSRNGVAVTVGVAVFDTKAAAEKAKKQAEGGVAALTGGGVNFCHGPVCRRSTNAIGRYAYFTISGYTSGKSVTTSDTKALGAGRDLADYAFRRILARGNTQASAAASATD
ncbi:hypothetical protein [Streptomyces coffeae]|uniref:Uncharacterized protein n=1 Tax=Streptomyces coffeae TaxID=621382 RepID=A0ABS1NH27_9ACTN|nr:hypothetical protein [Streptomyces coffeae]MBL1099338.1 hypothetical protein [Streptomyces coffeae]